MKKNWNQFWLFQRVVCPCVWLKKKPVNTDTSLLYKLSHASVTYDEIIVSFWFLPSDQQAMFQEVLQVG